MDVDTKLILQLKDLTGISLRQCNSALQLFDNNITQAYKFLELTHDGVCYRKPNGENFNKEDYVNYIENNMK